MTHLMKQDVNVFVVHGVEEVVWGKFFTPVVAVATHLTEQAIVEPETDVVSAVLATRALTDIIANTQMPATVTSSIAFRHTVCIGGGVNIQTSGVTLK